MREYRIAFFTVDWNYDLVESTLHGLKQFVDDHSNVHLCVFDCFGKDIGNTRDRFEYAIFDLPDLSQFDGLLLQGNQIILGSVRDSIAERIAQSGIPAVCIDFPLKGCTMIGIDNRKAQYDIASHVLREHGARRVVYLTGIMDEGVSEASQRLDGFYDACREAELAPEDIEILQCTWRPSDGTEVADLWVREDRPLPDAFICANDDMALALCERLIRYGFRVPEDVIVTGFDNISATEFSSPRLSTIHRAYDEMNYKAMDCLIDKIEGRENRSFVPFDYKPIYSESCGCPELVPPAHIRDMYFQQTRFLKIFYSMQSQLAEDLFNANGLPDLMDIIEKNNPIFGSESIYLCVNDYYFDNYERKQWHCDSERFGKEMVLAACGKSGYPSDEKHIYARFPTHQLLPRELMEAEHFLVFYPLHYNTYSIGYFVMNGISQAAKHNLHESIFTFLEIAIENVRKKRLLGQLNAALEDLYVHDALTGLYNRFGFEQYGQGCFDGFMMKDGGAQVLFVDMDDMKGINDRYGHEMGDAAIRTAAHVLQSVCGDDDFLMRYGGDEFLMIVSRNKEDIVQTIGNATEFAAQSHASPFRLSLSVGVVRADPGRTLAQCIQEADARMYNNKRNKRLGGA